MADYLLPEEESYSSYDEDDYYEQKEKLNKHYIYQTEDGKLHIKYVETGKLHIEQVKLRNWDEN